VEVRSSEPLGNLVTVLFCILLLFTLTVSDSLFSCAGVLAGGLGWTEQSPLPCMSSFSSS